MAECKVIRGKYSDYSDEIHKLIYTHWAEVGMPGSENLALKLDTELYKQMEALNQHLGLAIVKDNELIGYLSVFIYDHHQHTGTRFAQTDGFFINPKHRSFGTFKAVIQMFEKAQTILYKEFGVEYFLLVTNAVNDLKFMADSLGFTQSSITYTKRLG